MSGLTDSWEGFFLLFSGQIHQGGGPNVLTAITGTGDHAWSPPRAQSPESRLWGLGGFALLHKVDAIVLAEVCLVKNMLLTHLFFHIRVLGSKLQVKRWHSSEA